ncbi:MAG TPA: arsenate reductase ArsC [Syntrophomonas sp.]|nr:arsenate reductase ArsC [Syntrophomonas sp.]
MAKQKILFICTQNSARSQMAEGLLRSMYGDRFEVFSAGTNPFRVNPFAIAAMKNAGIDIRSHRSKSIDEFIHQDIDYAITVCDSAKETCPYFPNAKVLLHHSFSDPAAATGSEEEILAEFQRVRDEIRMWLVKEFGEGEK